MSYKKIVFFSIVLLGLHNTSMAQAFQKTPNGVKAGIQGADVEVQFYTPQIVRIIKLPAGSMAKEKSLAVIAAPQKLPLTITDQKDELTISSQLLEVKLNRQT